ncbi:MAG: hypothetical protein ACI92S_005233, partial [Planctomycetaceae bacterium]
RNEDARNIPFGPCELAAHSPGESRHAARQ